MNKVFALILFIVAFGANATSQVGIINFLYANDAKFQNQPKAETALESGAIVKITQFNQNVLDAMQVQLIKFPPQLQQKLNESNSFVSYDAESIVNSWKLVNPEILVNLENAPVAMEDTIVLKSYESQSTLKPAILKHSYILMGWIYSITSEITKNLIEGTDKKSILYNLDVRVKYKVIDQDNKTVITTFEARGHGGYATIVPNSAAVNNYNSDVAVSNAISSLLNSIKHGLLIKQSQGLFDK